MRRALPVLRSALVVSFLTTSLFCAVAQAAAPGWSDESATTMERGRLEIGAFSASKWAVTRRVEIGAHPVGLFLLPSVRAKINWWHDGQSQRASTWSFGSFHRMSVPTPFLNLVAKEGTGGLLPADTDVPFAMQWEHMALLSRAIEEHLVTLKAGFGFAAKERSDLPMIEFPFLYSDLAPLYSGAVLRFGLAGEGPVYGPFSYQVLHRLSLWKPYEDIPWPGEDTPTVVSQESALRLHFDLNDHHRLTAGAALSIANYPIGYRLHWTPTVDYRVALF